MASPHVSDLDKQGEGCILPLPETLTRLRIGNYDYCLHVKADPLLVQETQAIANASYISDARPLILSSVRVPDQELECPPHKEGSEEKDEDSLYGYSLFFLSSFVWCLLM